MGLLASVVLATFGACVGCFVGGGPLLGVVFFVFGFFVGADSNTCNSNNDSYWFARGFFGRPAGVRAAHALVECTQPQQLALWGLCSPSQRPYVAGKYGRWVALISRACLALPLQCAQSRQQLGSPA